MEHSRKTKLKNSISFQQMCIDINRQDLLVRWDYKLNEYNPDEISYSTNIKCWFKCPENKHNSELKNISTFNENGTGMNCNQCNLIYNTHPHLIKYFKNKENAKKYSSGSNKKVLMKCPDCGYEKEMIISNLLNRGFSCPRCGDGVSYPEKFMFNVLEQLNIDFIYQLTKTNLNWCNGYKYDFYISSLNCIIEVHGLQHYDNGFGRNISYGRTLKEEQENDQFKKQLALQNNIIYYIEIDCRQSHINFIKSNIIQSELSLLFNLNEINWIKCHEYALSSIVKEACNLWNNEIKSTSSIANLLKLHKTTIINYLKQGVELGWCDYDPKEASIKSGKDTTNFKKIICLTTNKIYENRNIAALEVGVNPATISRYCLGKIKTKPIKTKLRWMYYEDYLAMQGNNQISDL